MYSSVVVGRALAQREAEGSPGAATARRLAGGDGWSVEDVVCTHSRADRPFEERHHTFSVALVLAGTFQYHCENTNQLLSPGALMLGNAGTCFECNHEHAPGDRCVAFHFAPAYFEDLAADAGHRTARFPVTRIPPIRELARVSAAVAAKLLRQPDQRWEEVALEIAARALSLANHTKPPEGARSRSMQSRISDSIRGIEANPAAAHTIQTLAAQAGVGSWYYLRAFERLTGVTPHQFILRARLREAALRIAETDAQIATIAFQSGFGDLSNFNHTFRAEFGVTPRQWRARRLGS